MPSSNALNTARRLARAYDDARASAALARQLGNEADALAHDEIALDVGKHAAPRCLCVALIALSGVA